jgi:hypothetical protein
MRETYYEFSETLDDSLNGTESWEVKGANFGSMQFIASANTGTCVVRVEASNDGTNWINITADDSINTVLVGNVSKMVSLEGRTKYIRGYFVSMSAAGAKIKFIYIGGN